MIGAGTQALLVAVQTPMGCTFTIGIISPVLATGSSNKKVLLLIVGNGELYRNGTFITGQIGALRYVLFSFHSIWTLKLS
ncbi:hypothetical protein SAMN05421766_1067 [Zobellia uliginosa]|uniref:Uncharacterized protein n=1 Tax=Zobellia uliginosa TaxID=143224 RepID=A0ABY1KZG2_9FLAO|nr:hypothetical protein SAMN05421766_1067 [Zobellia uliginosa]